MATIKRIPVLWGGTTGMPGYSLFYAGAASDATADLVTFFTAMKTLFPAGLSWSIPPSGDTLDDGSGAITGTWSGTGAGIVTSTGSGVYAAGVGAWIAWNTGTIVGRRRLKGRTFICPLLTTSYSTGGSLATSTITTISGAASTLAATGKLVTWHRPKRGLTSGGVSALIVSSAVPNQVTRLRSRTY